MKRWLPALLGALSVFPLLLSSSPARADEPEAVHRYEDKSRPPGIVRTKLFLTGTAVTAGFYAPALGASYLWDQHHGAAQMRIPVAGPWLGVGRTKLCKGRSELPSCSNFLQVAGAIFLVLDGIGQAGGAALILESLFLPTGPSRFVRGKDKESASTSPRARASQRGVMTFGRGDFSLTPVPTVGGHSDVGLTFLGSF